MNTEDKKLLKQEVELFIDFLKLNERPQVFFIRRDGVNEAKLNENSNKNILCFNISFLEKFPLDFVMIVVLHEIFHFSKQDLKNYMHIAEMRYSHVWPFMQLYDIEADLYIVAYMRKENVIKDFAQYVEILHSGATAFQNTNIRLVKLERFIGSLITIKKYFETGQINIYLPKLSLNTVILLQILYERKHLHHKCFEIPTASLERWKMAFQNAHNMDWIEYIDFVERLTNDFISEI